MKTPIIVDEHGDIAIFESVAKAEIGLEPIDVRNGEYIAYDSDGRVLRLAVIQSEKPFLLGKVSIEAVEISETEEGTRQANNLRRALIEFFKKTKAYEQEDELLPLQNLIDKAVSHYGYTR